MRSNEMLTDFYPWSSRAADLGGKLLLVIDEESGSGEFAFNVALFQLLRDPKAKVLLLSIRYSIEHYKSLLRKNGLDFTSLVTEDRLSLLFLQDSFFGAALDGSQDEVGRTVYTWETLTGWQENGSVFPSRPSTEELGIPFYFLVDDVEAMNAISPDTASSIRFMQRLFDCKHIEGTAFYGRITRGSNDVTFDSQNHLFGDVQRNDLFSGLPMGRNASTQSTEEFSLTEYCRYRADVTVVVSSLSTGYSSECHGSLCVTARARFATGVHPTRQNTTGNQLHRQLLIFKATDSGIRCSALTGRN